MPRTAKVIFLLNKAVNLLSDHALQRASASLKYDTFLQPYTE